MAKPLPNGKVDESQKAVIPTTDYCAMMVAKRSHPVDPCKASMADMRALECGQAV